MKHPHVEDRSALVAEIHRLRALIAAAHRPVPAEPCGCIECKPESDTAKAVRALADEADKILKGGP